MRNCILLLKGNPAPSRIFRALSAAAICAALCIAAAREAAAKPQIMGEDIGGRPCPSVWDSQWCDDGASDIHDYKVLMFRRTFDLDIPPQHFRINVSADNRYRLFVNGKSVAAGPARGDLRNWFYDELDIAPHLKSGRNVIAALVWNAGDFKPCAQMSLRTGFILDGETQAEHFVSTHNGWKVKRSAAYTPAKVRALDTGAGDDIDATRYDWGWTLPDFDDSRWGAARAISKGYNAGAIDNSGWELRPREMSIPEETPQRLAKIRRFAGVAKVPNFISGKGAFTIPPNTKCSVLLDNETLTTAYPKLLVSGGAGAKIVVKYAEALFDKNQNKANRNDIDGRDFHPYRYTYDIFRPDGGANREFSTLWYRTYRYVGLYIETKDSPLVVNDFYGLFTAYPFAERGAFDCDDKSVAKIWEAGWRTARLCAHETYMDCPYYEQLQYIGDTRIQALVSLYVSGDDRMMRRAIELFDASRRSFGLTMSRYPTEREQIIPTFSLFWISMLHDYARFRGDAEFVKKHLAGVRGIIEWFADRLDAERGMLRPRLPYWQFADWCTTKGMRKGWHETGWVFGIPPEDENAGSSINTLHFALTLRQAAELMDLLPDKYYAKKYRALAEKVAADTYARCFDKTRGVFLDYEGAKSSSQNANIMAVLADALPRGQQRELMQKTVSDPTLTQCTFYYRFYLTEALKKVGMADRYYAELKPWRDMLDIGLTTFAENPEPARSDCHAWSASPNYHLLSVVCGIEPAEFGFKKVRIAPNLGELKRVSGKVPHPNGLIEVEFERKSANGIAGEIRLPDGLDGEFLWRGKTVKLVGGKNKIDIEN